FVVSLTAIIPISAIVRLATKDITLKLQTRDHEFLAGLFNGLFGNCAELCFALTATMKGKSAVAQTTLTGSIISYCLISFGTCLIFGGISRERQSYPMIIARTNAQLLVVSLISITLPTAFKTWSEATSAEDHSGPLLISHGSAIVLLLEFASYILFFYHTHIQTDHTTPAPSLPEGLIVAGFVPALLGQSNLPPVPFRTLRDLRTAAQDSRSQDDRPQYPIYVAVFVLMSGITAQVFASIFILEAIDSPVRSMRLSKSFVGLVIMPLVISSVEHLTAALRSHKDGIAWVTEVAFGSCIRITLFVFPLAVIVGWIAGVPGMSMIFDGFQVTILALTILLVNHVIQNGFLHWIEGTLFISSFLLFAITVWHYP
ncbi:hypothetical protein EK21DRAFT_15760, partial [Setomelanomma holmii]